jgi:antitoxin MazE
VTTRVQKWGNSLAIRIPRSCAEGMGLTEGTPVSLEAKNGTLLVQPMRERVPSLSRLLERVTADNIHVESDWGAPVGREAW